MQAASLVRRMQYANLKHPVVGISGGVDSTLAVIICAEAVKMMGLPADYVTAVTMPCFGTTDRTKSNAIIVSEQLGATVRVIDIGESVMQHFKDIGHDPENRNVVYENSQARERTQILMDVANGFADGGIHVGTEDMSEFADGWCTYNGDHISMYDVNAGSTKTMVQMVVRYVAETTDDKVLAKALLDVLDTPVSPELLPPTRNGEIAQKSDLSARTTSRTSSCTTWSITASRPRRCCAWPTSPTATSLTMRRSKSGCAATAVASSASSSSAPACRTARRSTASASRRAPASACRPTGRMPCIWRPWMR